ncbi:P4B major core protein [Catovirus CTV1]|uniref:p4B major core protein n=1 Tax=Catovirus CTV1 TaxID=1977631 RepID=A0A1V0SCD2_9VIRU|nr:P4B major core protein [Catovirus CTV1]
MSYPDTRGINTNTKENSSTDFRGDARGEVGKLIRENADDSQVLRKIREKYADKDTVDKIYSEYEKRMNHIKRKAQKFAQLVLTRYNHLGTQRVIEKAKKLKKKYEFTDDEFHAFVNIALSDRNIAGVNVYNVPNTPMSKTLGYTPDSNVGKLSYKADDGKYLQEILALHQSSLALHSQVVAQSLVYRDMAPEALTGKFDRSKMNAYNYIHPVIVALFLPRIKYIDEHMLIGSISNVVAQRQRGEPIKIQPDWELFYDIITDPNEIACASFRDSPMQDLLHRTKLQVELWKAVRDLRNGRYYPNDADAASFMAALEQCKNSIFDAPDMTFVKDEGTILRKLMGAFSLRPTIVSITPFGGTMTVNYPMSAHALTQVTSIPIVNFRLPLDLRGTNLSVNLQESLAQPDMYVENKMIVAKMKNIIYSRDLIVFYVNRRYQNINFARLVAPHNFTMLPTTLSGFETINEVQVNYPSSLNVGDESFTLRSVVMVEKSCFNRDPSRDPVKEIIVGSSAGLIVPEDISKGKVNKSCFIYDPQSSALKIRSDTGAYEDYPPISWVPCTSGLYTSSTDFIEPFDSRACKRGTIYVYVKPEASAFCRLTVC